MIYLDHNATTPPAPEAVQDMVDVLGRVWANPSSTHAPGQAARRLLADARARVARLLGCLPAELIFTSGATEANHMAVHGALARARGTPRRRWLLSAVEHPGLMQLADRLCADGTPVDFVAVNPDGRVNLSAVEALLTDDVALLSVMGANNETGALMPLEQLSAMARRHQVPFHVDATQLVGRSTLRFAASGIDLMSVSAHKLHGPKGVGALVVRQGFNCPAWVAGRQERGRRGGTENLPGIVGFAAAADRLRATEMENLTHMLALRERLERGLLTLHPGVHLFAATAPRLPNTVCVRFGRVMAERVLDKLERAGVVASSGAACSAAGTEPSHVLLAMGASDVEAKAGVRFSLGRETSRDEIELALAAVQRVVLPLLTAEATEAAACHPMPEVTM